MEQFGGRRTVGTIYVVSVLLAGLFGYVLGAIVLPNAAKVPSGVEGELGPITFPLTGPALAIYGMLTIGVLLGAGLLAVTVASRYDAAAPENQP